MNPRIERLKQRARDGEHHSLRRQEPVRLLEECEAEHLSWSRRVARLTVRQCEAEIVVVPPDERIVFTRTLPTESLRSTRGTNGIALPSDGRTTNSDQQFCADSSKPFRGPAGAAESRPGLRARCHDQPQAVNFLEGAIVWIDASWRGGALRRDRPCPWAVGRFPRSSHASPPSRRAHFTRPCNPCV